MKIMAGIISLISLALLIITWNTPLAIAWTVAFCGWFPQAFNKSKETANGHQA